MTLLERIFGAGKAATRDADAIIERLVKATDPRLTFVKGYQDALRRPVLGARDRMLEAVARIPGPVEMSARAWSADNSVRPLFARGSDIAPAFSNDPGVRAFFAAHPGADCFAMLALEMRQRRVLASALHGDSVHAEVARATLSFEEPRMLAPAAQAQAVRAELALRALEHLALRAMQRLGDMRLQRQELERERALLTARLRLASSRGAGLAGVGTAHATAEIERDLERNVAQLEAGASRKFLPALLEGMIQALEQPEQHLGIEPCTVTLDAMNFVVDAGAPGAVTPRVAMLTLPQRGAFGVVIARFPRSELKAAASFADARFI